MATPWLLIRFFGVRGAILWAVAANAAAGLLAITFYGWLRRAPDESPSAEASVPSSARGPTQSFALWMGLYALSGFCALSLEILWFRMLDVAVKANAFTFGTMLAVYLMGSAAGCLAGAPFDESALLPAPCFLSY